MPSSSILCSSSYSYLVNYELQAHIYGYLNEKAEEVELSRSTVLGIYCCTNMITIVTRIIAIAEVFFKGLYILLSAPFASNPISNAKIGLNEVCVHTLKNILRLFFLPLESLADIIHILVEPMSFSIHMAETMKVHLSHARAGSLHSDAHEKDLNPVSGIAYGKLIAYQRRMSEIMDIDNALSRAVSLGNVKLVDSLIGSTPLLVNLEGEKGTPLLHASYYQYEDRSAKMAKKLIEGGANINFSLTERTNFLKESYPAGSTPLFIAVLKQNKKLVDLLLSCGAKIKQLLPKINATPITDPISYGLNAENVDFIIEQKKNNLSQLDLKKWILLILHMKNEGFPLDLFGEIVLRLQLLSVQEDKFW